MIGFPTFPIQGTWVSKILIWPLRRTGIDALSEILDKASKARSKGIQLKGMEFATALSNAMLKNATELEDRYAKLKAAVTADAHNESEIAAMLEQLASKKSSFEKSRGMGF